MRILILMLALVLFILPEGVPAASQQGRGLVIVQSRQPAVLLDHMFPRLYRVDPVTGVLEGAAPENLAVVVDAQASPEQEQTIRLRDDLLWSDGTPVSAYDVLYSMMHGSIDFYAGPNLLEGIAILDDNTLTLRYRAPGCANAARTNMVIDYAGQDFAAFARDLNAERPGIIPVEDWLAAYGNARLSGVISGAGVMYLADGLRPLPAERPGELRRYLGSDLALLLVEEAAGQPKEDQFLSGTTNLLLDADLERRADLLTQEDVQIYTAPGWEWDYLVFNFADSTIPRSAYTTSGAQLDQGRNRFFSDKRLRQAVQLGIDVNAIIEAVFQGAADPLTGTLPPASWGAHPALQPAGYDPGRAARLLDEAGWVDTDGDGIRNCFRCQTAETGTSLYLNLGVESGRQRDRVVEMIQLQLWRIGIGITYTQSSGTDQRFDMFLGGFDYWSPYAADPDQTLLFARAGDMIGLHGNNGSYHNPALETLLEQARMVADCDVSARSALYQQVQELLADDLPMIGLYVRHDFYAARGIEGFAPQPGNPFWNLMNWRVSS